MDVTAIIPTFNRAEFLDECLTSVCAQVPAPRQIVVVDDGSVDGTPAVVQRFGPRVDYVRTANGGKASALNAGLRRTRGSAVWIVDDDDVVESGALSRLTGALDARPDAGFAYGKYRTFSVGTNGKRFSAPVRARYGEADLCFAMLERCAIYQVALLVRTSCYESVGPFDEAFTRSQDYDMLVRLCRRFPGVYVPHVMFSQRQHAGIRGTARDLIHDAERHERQRGFDALVMQRAYASFALSEYLPASQREAPQTPALHFTALLRRSTMMARKMLWTEASADLTDALELAREHRIKRLSPSERGPLTRLFDEYGYAKNDCRAGNPLLRCLTPDARPFSEIRACLLWPLFRSIVRNARTVNLTMLLASLRSYRQLSDRATLRYHAGWVVKRKAIG